MKLFKRTYRIVHDETIRHNTLTGEKKVEDRGYYIEEKSIWTIIFMLFTSNGVWDRINLFGYESEEEAQRTLKERGKEKVERFKTTTKETFRITI